MPVFYPENPGTIGEHLKRKRIDSRLLQKDVAKIFGVTEDCIINWEKNRSVPQIQFFPLIIEFLGFLPFHVKLTTLSGRLKTYRHIKGMSQKQLGQLLNVDGATISAWEQGENQPYRRTLIKINDLFEEISSMSDSI